VVEQYGVEETATVEQKVLAVPPAAELVRAVIIPQMSFSKALKSLPPLKRATRSQRQAGDVFIGPPWDQPKHDHSKVKREYDRKVRELNQLRS
jgi:hypothetical protein